MTLELVKCPHCGYRYRTDIKRIAKDGETIAVRSIFSDISNVFTRNTTKDFSIDLMCPNCDNEFAWEVNT